MTSLPAPELRTSFEVGHAFSLVHGELVPTDLLWPHVCLDEADNNPTMADYMRPLLVTGLPRSIRVLFLDILESDGERTETESIGYFVARHDAQDGTSLLVPGDLLERDPRTWIDDNLRNMLQFLGRENLEEFSLGTLADYIDARRQA